MIKFILCKLDSKIITKPVIYFDMNLIYIRIMLRPQDMKSMVGWNDVGEFDVVRGSPTKGMFDKT